MLLVLGVATRRAFHVNAVVKGALILHVPVVVGVTCNKVLVPITPTATEVERSVTTP